MSRKPTVGTNRMTFRQHKAKARIVLGKNASPEAIRDLAAGPSGAKLTTAAEKGTLTIRGGDTLICRYYRNLTKERALGKAA